MVIGSRVRLLVGKLALDLRTLDSSELLNPNVSNPISTHYEEGTSKNGTCTTELAVLTRNKVRRSNLRFRSRTHRPERQSSARRRQVPDQNNSRELPNSTGSSAISLGIRTSNNRIPN